MKYVLSERYRFRGWQKSATGLYDMARKDAIFMDKKKYLMLLKCDGAHDINTEDHTEDEKAIFNRFLEMGFIHPAGFAEYIRPEQEYKSYPARYKKQAHWSITGACNLKCLHCFMSAPDAKHGAPTHEQIISIADQLAECGVFQVGLTGGEPLVRSDLLEIIDALLQREIGIDVIYTNGALLDETFLDELDKRRIHPAFQLSFDGLGHHDFLRGVPGTEEKTINALKLLQKRDYRVSVSMCMHRGNRQVLRETINFLASLGVRSIKCGSMMELGEWARPEMAEYQMTREEELQMFEEYIPQYFEDDAPMSIMMGGVFMYTPGDDKWEIFFHRECSAADEVVMPSCGILKTNFYIGADGMICPCMGMADCGYAGNFPNLFKTPLSEILGESEFNDLCDATVGQIRDHNPKCRECKYVDRCTGGCRNSALMAGDDYYGIDEGLCWFFENDGEERIRKAAEGPFAEYIKRNPPREKEKKEDGESVQECP
ncbi:MAG: radical SAM protein [Lachnospiraceae bacterium]|nr:radical SAM protein [Lachnospiraceae bacterium]